MPEIHLINGEPRECSDAIRARGLIDEWLANPNATEAKVAQLLAAEAAERAKYPPIPKHQAQQVTDATVNQVVKPADTPTGPTPSRRRGSAPEERE